MMFARGAYQVVALLAFLSSCTWTIALASSKRDAQNLLNFLVVGDLGSVGTRQRQVARSMDEWSRRINANFTLNLGDNFYESGVKSKDDPLWEQSWRKEFSKPGLNHTWYSIAGNHDYRQNPNAQVEYSLDPSKDQRWYMPALYYTFTHTFGEDNGTTVQFFMIDTTPMHDRPSFEANKDQYNWLEKGLAQSVADWVVVAGHHPIFSSAGHGNTPALVDFVLPMLIKYGVALYMCGHDHVLQYIVHMGNVRAPDHLVSGAGSKLRLGFENDNNVLVNCYRASAWATTGFASVTLSAQEMSVRILEVTDSQTQLLRAFMKPNPRRINATLNYDSTCQAMSELLNKNQSTTRLPMLLWLCIVAFGCVGLASSVIMYIRLRHATRMHQNFRQDSGFVRLPQEDFDVGTDSIEPGYVAESNTLALNTRSQRP